MNNNILDISIFFNIYFWESESEWVWVGEGQTEGDTESKASSRLWTVSTEPDMGLQPMNYEIMTWAEIGHSTDWATQVPNILDISNCDWIKLSSR